MTRRTVRPGMTLVELVAALAVIAVASAVAALAFWPSRTLPEEHDTDLRINAVRQRAITYRRPVSATLRVDGGVVDVTALPDGSIILDTPGERDPLAGIVHDHP